MALTKLSVPGISTGGDYQVDTLTSIGTVQIGSATTVHTTGIDLGSGNITGHNLFSTGIITAVSFVGDISQATGAAAGLGTALSQDQSNPLNKAINSVTVSFLICISIILLEHLLSVIFKPGIFSILSIII